MASPRAGSLAETGNSAGFSYAQAAKGRSTSTPSAKASSGAMSGTTTPASNSIPDSTPGTSWADDGEPAGSTNPPSHRRDVGSTPDDPTLTPKNDDADTAASAGTPRAHAASLTAVTTVDSSKKPDGEDHSRQSHNQSMAAEVSTSVEAADVPAPQDAVKSADAIDGPSKEDTTPKLAYQEARPPPVNPWLQRAADAKAKAAVHPVAKSTAVSGSRDIGSASVDQRRKSEAPHPRDSRRNDARPRDDFRNGRQRQDQRVDEGATSAQRKGASRARDRASSEAGPPPRAEISWPKPMDAHDEDRKKTHDPSDKTEKDRSGTNAGKGKPEWKVMPYTPTAVFETQITGKGSGRMGKGAARGVPTGSGRGPVGPASATNGTGESSKPSERVSPLSNGETSTPDKAGTGKAEGDVPSASGRIVSETPQDGRPIEPRTTVPSEPADTTAKDLDSGIASTLDDTTRPAPAARRNKSPRRSDAFVRRTGSVHDSTGRRFSAATHSEDTANLPVNGELPASRSAFADRRSETQSFDSGRDVPPFREGKRGGRKGGRGGFNNAQFGSPHGYNNGYPDYQNGNHSPGVPFSPRAGHYSQGSRSGYRNQGMRAQSIPVDAFGRSVPYGYPMMPMQPMMPDYYNSFSPGSHGFQSQSEREMLVTSVAMQVEYYFSIDNLLKDIFLRKHMDSQGWIFLSVVAEFNRLKTFTTDYEVLKQACLQSREVEIRVADDGKDRLRKVGEWQRWVLPVEDRDALAQGESPSNLRRPSAPRVHSVEQAPIFYPASPASAQFSSPYGRTDRSFQIVNGGPPPFYPSGSEQRHNDYSKPEESRGRQPRFAHHRESSNVSPLTNGHPSTTEASGEPDKFPSSQIEGLTVVVRKHDLRGGAPFHSASSRTFSNGSIDSRSIMEEVSKPQVQASKVNGVAPSESGSSAETVTSLGESLSPQETSALALFWVKDKENPVDVSTLPEDTTHEPYVSLRFKALSQRDVAATGTCPYDLDVLYQFWSHFLIRNFNLRMYSEFHHFATEDAAQRHNDTGHKNLIKYYSEALASQIPIRDGVAREYADLVKAESTKTERPAFKQLREAWRNGALNLKNRKKLGDMLDDSIKTELDS